MSGEMKKLRLNSRARKAFQGSSRGFTLIEVVIAIALIGIIAVAVLSALSTASISLIIADKRATAESLARSQLEFVKNQDYIDYSESGHEDYDVICDVVECPEDYTVEVVAEPIDPDTYQPYPYIEGEGRFQQDDGIQKITVIVSYDGKEVITMEGYKRNPEIEE
jgi:prepilin-type N-terminal cleavage/methylation domain-containing protein